MAHGPPPGHASFGDAGNRPAAQTATEAEGYAGVASSTPASGCQPVAPATLASADRVWAAPQPAPSNDKG